MTDNKATKKDKPKAAAIDVDVVNPRYEGATFEMVVKAMLQRPRKGGNPNRKDDPEGGSGKPPRPGMRRSD